MRGRDTAPLISFILATGLLVIQMVVCGGYIGVVIVIEYLQLTNQTSFLKDIADNYSINCMLPKEHWKFITAVTISSVAAILSYLLMTLVVVIPINSKCSGYNCHCCPCITYKKALTEEALSLYNDEDKLNAVQTCYFFTNYFVVLILFAVSKIFSIVYAASGTEYYRGCCWVDSLYLAMIILQIFSHFCAIQSCFIFSKIVYKVTNKMKYFAETKFAEELVKRHLEIVNSINSKLVNKGDNRETSNLFQTKLEQSINKEIERGHYHLLRKMDKEFVNELKPTLHLFGVWFIFHWTLYALTTVLLSAFLVQNIVEVLQYGLQSVQKSLPNSNPGSLELYLVYVTLVHGYLFLYPCFRAAAIATSRTKMITTISETPCNIISLLNQISFVQYLTSKDFSFQVPLFCSSIPIGFNWVFVSFFVPVFGAYLAF